MNRLRREDDGERGRLPPPREEYERFIEDRGGRHHQQRIQPGYDGRRDVVHRGPEVLHALDCEDVSTNQDVKNVSYSSFVNMMSRSWLPFSNPDN